jgi:hypothetical protein
VNSYPLIYSLAASSNGVLSLTKEISNGNAGTLLKKHSSSGASIVLPNAINGTIDRPLVGVTDTLNRVYAGYRSIMGFKIDRYTESNALDGSYLDAEQWGSFYGYAQGTTDGRVFAGLRTAANIPSVLALKDDMTALPTYPKAVAGAISVALDSSNQVLVSKNQGGAVVRFDGFGQEDAAFTAGVAQSCAGAPAPIVAVQKLDNKPIVSVGTDAAFVLKRLWQ